MKNHCYALGTGLLLFAFAALPFSRAQIIYDNLGNSNPFTPAFGQGVGGGEQVAVRFVAQNSLWLDYAELQIWGAFSFGAPNPLLKVSLFADGVANKPGGLLEEVVVVLPPDTRQPAVPLLRAEFSNTQLLMAGTVYWLAASTTNDFVSTAWESPGPLGTVAIHNFYSGANYWGVVWTAPEAGMRIYGAAAATPVPEAANMGLASSALLFGLIFCRRRFSRFSRVQN